MIVSQLQGEAEQVALGRRLAAVVGSKALIFLKGELGAGKTTLARGFLQGRGHRGNVKSPSYTLIEPYRLAEGACYHLDLYRVADPEELEYLGLRDLLQEQAVLLVEWPERGAGWLPTPDLEIALSYAASGDAREARFGAHSPVGREILSGLSGP